MMRVGVWWCGSLTVWLALAGCQGGEEVVVIYTSGGAAGATGVAGSTMQSAGSAGSGNGTSGAGGAQAGSGGTAGGQAGFAGLGGAGGNLGIAGTGGSAGGGGAPTVCVPWPAATSTEQVAQTIEVSATYDGGFKRLVGVGDLGSGSQNEDQPPFFRLANGAVLKNVILGGPSADGVHCDGSCVLTNVWWEDVGEDAATLDGDSSSQTMTIECSGARQAEDKVFQHNGAGTMILRNVFAEDFNKLYRSCGNCQEQFTRHVRLENVTVENGLVLVGLNENYGDTAEFSNVTVDGSITVCQRYVGNDTGAEPYIVGEGPDSEHCLYEPGDIQ